MAAPAYITSGSYSLAGGTSALAPAYPAGIQAGDLLILQVGHQNHVTQSAATYTFPAAFTSWFADQQSDTRQWIRYCIADGTETGAISITVSGGTAAAWHRAVIHQFSDTDSPPTAEGSALGSAAPGSTSLTDTGVTTTGNDRLALNFITTSASNTPASFTGETGGDWTLATSSGTGLSALWLETAAMAAAATIDGGAKAISSTAWLNRGFALIPATASTGQPFVKRWGGVPFSIGGKGVW